MRQVTSSLLAELTTLEKDPATAKAAKQAAARHGALVASGKGASAQSSGNAADSDGGSTAWFFGGSSAKGKDSDLVAGGGAGTAAALFQCRREAKAEVRGDGYVLFVRAQRFFFCGSVLPFHGLRALHSFSSPSPTPSFPLSTRAINRNRNRNEPLSGGGARRSDHGAGGGEAGASHVPAGGEPPRHGAIHQRRKPRHLRAAPA